MPRCSWKMPAFVYPLYTKGLEPAFVYPAFEVMVGRGWFPFGMAQPGRCELLVLGTVTYIYIFLVYPPPRMPVTNEGLGWDSL